MSDLNYLNSLITKAGEFRKFCFRQIHFHLISRKTSKNLTAISNLLYCLDFDSSYFHCLPLCNKDCFHIVLDHIIVKDCKGWLWSYKGYSKRSQKCFAEPIPCSCYSGCRLGLINFKFVYSFENCLRFFNDWRIQHAVLREYAAHVETLVGVAINKLNFSSSSKF